MGIASIPINGFYWKYIEGLPSMKFAEKLRELRESKGLTQKALADASGQAQQSLARWENGAQVPSIDAVQSICRALGVECTVFNGCDYEPVEDKRGRGRPRKDANANPARQRKKKGKGAP
jgi:transcriptional regulator with XRE-family HTH domain